VGDEFQGEGQTGCGTGAGVEGKTDEEGGFH